MAVGCCEYEGVPTVLQHLWFRHAQIQEQPTTSEFAGGRRLLRQWLCRPLRNPADINDRLDAVDEISSNPGLIAPLRRTLKAMPDLERALGRARNSGAPPAVGLPEWAVKAAQNRFVLGCCCQGLPENGPGSASNPWLRSYLRTVLRSFCMHGPPFVAAHNNNGFLHKVCCFAIHDASKRIILKGRLQNVFLPVWCFGTGQIVGSKFCPVCLHAASGTLAIMPRDVSAQPSQVCFLSFAQSDCAACLLQEAICFSSCSSGGAVSHHCTQLPCFRR